MVTFIDEIRKRARKEHLCDECRRKIDVGTLYYQQVYSDDGEFCVYKAHIECEAATTAYRKLADLHPEDTFFLHDLTFDDSAWLWAEHPRAAERICMPSLSWAHRYITRRPM